MLSVLALCLVGSLNIGSVMSCWRTSAVVLIRERVSMNCSVNTSDVATWTYTAWNTSTETNSYSGRDIVTSMRSRYKIDRRISGEHNLIIESVDLFHAGRYKCTAIMEGQLKMDVLLAVLASTPYCSSNNTNADEGKIEKYGYLWMMCRITYRPAEYLISIFTWTKDNTASLVANTITAADSRTVALTTTSSVLVQVHSDDKVPTFKCKIRFQSLNDTKVRAPDYEYTWNYTTYGPKNLSIVEYEDRLECSADGNPTPNYRWTDVSTKASKEGSVFMLDASYDNERTLQCTAANIFGAENQNLTVSGKKSTGISFVMTTLTIGGSLLFLLTIAVIVSCVVHKKRLKDRSTRQPCNPVDDTTVQKEASDSDNYCALTKQRTDDQEAQVYCELRSFDYM